MSMLLSRMVAFAIAVVLLGTAATASARPKKHSPERTSTAITMCDGTPIIMQGIECKKRPAGGEEQATHPPVRPRITPPGSGGLYPPAPPTPPTPPLPHPTPRRSIPPPTTPPPLTCTPLNP